MSEPRHHNTIAGAIHGSAVLARDITADTIIVQSTRPGGATVRPQQLPLPGRAWVNRETELNRLERLAAQPGPTLVLVTGMGGVGKTALAIRWLTRHQTHHSDGTLYVDLGGFANLPAPAPDQVLSGWVRALGVPADEIPANLAELVALYRTMTAHRSLCVLLDNAATAAQIDPLLPTAATSVVVVTSRHRLAGLAVKGFAYLDLDCLSRHDSTTLLLGLLPDKAAETSEMQALADHCRGLPLALLIAGGYLTVHSRHSLAGLVDRLATDPRQPLELHLDDISVRGVLDASYEQLTPGHARLYRWCALHPGAEFSPGPLAAAGQQSELDTDRGLGVLVNASLLIEPTQGRYRLHDLVREHANTLAQHHDPPDQRDLALRRMIEWYLRRTAEADLTLNPFGPRFSPVFDGLTTTTFADAAAARAWFDTNRATILACPQLAADHGWDELAYQLAEALWNALRTTYSAEDLLHTQQLGAQAAHRCRTDHAAPSPATAQLEAVCLVRVAFAESNRGHHEAAIAAATAALNLATALGHDWTRSAALSTRARAHLAAGNPRAALADLYPSLDIAQRHEDQRSIALRHRRIGQALTHATVAEYPRAIEHLRHAATLLDSVGDALGHARVIIYLAAALVENGQPALALPELEQVVDAVRAHGSVGYTADLCTALGTVHAHLGHRADADTWYAEAAALYDTAGPGAAKQRDSVAVLRTALPALSTRTSPTQTETDMAEPILLAIAAHLAGKTVGTLYELVKSKFAGQPAAEATLAAAAGAAPDSAPVQALTAELQKAAAADPAFAAKLETTWRANVEQHADHGGVTNSLSGPVSGSALQARDLHIDGGLRFGSC